MIALHRYYRKLKASDKYTRRISWLAVGSSDHTKACAEYLDEFPGLMPHGNSKTDQVGYKRTAATVLDAIGQELEKTKSVQSTFGKLQNESMYTMQPRPRNSKQVENKKYNDAKAKRDELGPNIVGSNLADHFQHILSVTHPFIQFVGKLQGKSPTVTLYTPAQILRHQEILLQSSDS